MKNSLTKARFQFMICKNTRILKINFKISPILSINKWLGLSKFIAHIESYILLDTKVHHT